MAPPSVQAMIANHTLARNIIEHHGTRDDILDNDELAILRKFCNDTSSKENVLAGADMADIPQRLLDSSTGYSGSLAGYCVATYGTARSALTEGEIHELKGWFADGMSIKEGTT